MRYMKYYLLLIPSFLCLTFFAFVISPTAASAQTFGATHVSNNTSNNTASTSTLEHQVFELINRKRAENGLQPLVWSERVAQVARLHSRNMASYNFFSHVGVDGKRVDSRANSTGLSNWRSIGENIAYNRGFGNPVERVVEQWMRSPGHRDNLLGDGWKESGVGITIASDGRYYFTQVFIKK
jgi:uncharacterized protein YkwD